jgi:hypothetical protein
MASPPLLDKLMTQIGMPYILAVLRARPALR